MRNRTHPDSRGRAPVVVASVRRVHCSRRSAVDLVLAARMSYASLAIGFAPNASDEPSRFGIHPLSRGTRGRVAECLNLEGFCVLPSPIARRAPACMALHRATLGKDRPAALQTARLRSVRVATASTDPLTVTRIAEGGIDYTPPGTWATKPGQVTYVSHSSVLFPTLV